MLYERALDDLRRGVYSMREAEQQLREVKLLTLEGALSGEQLRAMRDAFNVRFKL